MPGAGACDGANGKEDQVLSLSADAAMAAEGGLPGPGLPRTSVASEQTLARIIDSLDDSKAEDIVQIDLRGRTALADYMVICSGRSSRHVGAIAEALSEALKPALGRTPRTEGKAQGEWILIDAGDVIVHVFQPEIRAFYQLEKMWMPAEAAAHG